MLPRREGATHLIAPRRPQHVVFFSAAGETRRLLNRASSGAGRAPTRTRLTLSSISHPGPILRKHFPTGALAGPARCVVAPGDGNVSELQRTTSGKKLMNAESDERSGGGKCVRRGRDFSPFVRLRAWPTPPPAPLFATECWCVFVLGRAPGLPFIHAEVTAHGRGSRPVTLTFFLMYYSVAHVHLK